MRIDWIEIEKMRKKKFRYFCFFPGLFRIKNAPPPGIFKKFLRKNLSKTLKFTLKCYCTAVTINIELRVLRVLRNS